MSGNKKLANYKIDEDLKANIEMVADHLSRSATSYVSVTMEAAVNTYLKDNNIKPTTAAKWAKEKDKKK